jgi:hypothetical protein
MRYNGLKSLHSRINYWNDEMWFMTPFFTVLYTCFFLMLITATVSISIAFAQTSNDQVKIGNRWFDKHTPTALELNDLKVTTHGVHDWLQRSDGNICMNPLSPTTVIAQKTWQNQIDYVKTHGGRLNYLDNPWPLLCSTNLSQALDYYRVYVNHK